MSHLLSGLLRLNDPVLFGLALLEAIAGSAIAVSCLYPCHPVSLRRSAMFGMVAALTAWAVFKTALHGSFPGVPLHTPFAWAAPALAVAILGSGAAAFNQARGRRSARAAMLSGSLMASGVSCMLFTAMAGVVQPFALAYDLSAVLATTIGASALFSFAFWEVTNAERRHPRLVAISLGSLATMVSCIGSLSSILPFDGWMTTLGEPDDLSSVPLLIIGASEAAVVLALSLFGSLVDNRAAARDRLETERLRELAGSTFEAIVIHRDGIVLDGNDVLSDLTGRSLPTLVGSPVEALCAQGQLFRVFEIVEDRSPLQVSILGAGGEQIPVEILSRPISYAGEPAVATALRDVRERHASEARIRFLAHHDTLTKLPNRALMGETMAQFLEQCGQAGSLFSVLCLDLDGFKLVNDTLGHAAGDQLLCDVAQRLRANIRTGDFVARLGGDEFIVVSPAVPQPAQAAKLAQRLVTCLSDPFDIEGRDVRIGTSIGVATYPLDGTDTESILRHADIALYRAKQEGRGTYCFFKHDMGQAIERQGDIEQALQGALDRNEISVHFQPVFNAEESLIGFEALLRWIHPSLGEVSPAIFVPIAEQSNLIAALGERVLRVACAAAMGWPKPYRVAVNISPRQILRGDLTELVDRILAETGLPASRLELEVTERALATNGKVVHATMAALRARGTRLVLDDFGTGPSSLSSLHQFPFDKLKVDRSLIERLPRDESARSIVQAITAMARCLGLNVTAEGVETIQQLDLVRDEGCDAFQGFLLGRPMPASQVEAFVTSRPGERSATASPTTQFELEADTVSSALSRLAAR